MLLGDVVDQFLNEDSLADTGATEQSDLAALKKRLDEIDDFHAGLKHLGGRGLLFERRRRAVDRAVSWCARPGRVDRQAGR